MRFRTSEGTWGKVPAWVIKACLEDLDGARGTRAVTVYAAVACLAWCQKEYSQADIQAETGMPKTKLCDGLNDLEEIGLVARHHNYTNNHRDRNDYLLAVVPSERGNLDRCGCPRCLISTDDRQAGQRRPAHRARQAGQRSGAVDSSNLVEEPPTPLRDEEQEQTPEGAKTPDPLLTPGANTVNGGSKNKNTPTRGPIPKSQDLHDSAQSARRRAKKERGSSVPPWKQAQAAEPAAKKKGLKPTEVCEIVLARNGVI